METQDKTPIIMVSYYSPHNVKRLALQLKEHLPDVPLIVIDNSRSHPKIIEERKWLESEGIQRIEVGPDLEHGVVLDLVRPMLIDMGYKTMVHIEPDCVVESRHWYDYLLDPLQEDMWASFSVKYPDGRYHPTPSAWNLEKTIYLSWVPVSKGAEINHFLYSSLIQNDACSCEWLKKSWDTAQYAWFCCAIANKAAIVSSPGFTHMWGGTYKDSIFITPLL